ncbi:hypothetical protein FRC03_003060 [Tulasnella sp. 419]|nr:hypothetical protein FRC03_003060 [Tulasnella sp. 419]
MKSRYREILFVVVRLVESDVLNEGGRQEKQKAEKRASSVGSSQRTRDSWAVKDEEKPVKLGGVTPT